MNVILAIHDLTLSQHSRLTIEQLNVEVPQNSRLLAFASLELLSTTLDLDTGTTGFVYARVALQA